jgi:hypothetical protein
MASARRISRTALVIGLAGTLLGFAVAGVSALAAGDWYLAPKPWIGLGIALIVWSLALCDLAGVVLLIVERLDWRWRVLAVPAGVLLAFFWAEYLVVGLPTTAPGGLPEHDMGAIFYSAPAILALFVALTAVLLLPLPAAALARRQRLPAA